MEENKKFKLSDQQISTSLSSEAVILNHKKGTYFSLNEVGTFVWSQFEGNHVKTFAELKDALLSEFDIDEPTCKVDLVEILTDLVNEKLVDEVA